MEKMIIFLIIFCSYKTLYSQNKIEFDKFPFDMETLQDLSYRKDSIMPKFIDDKFYYINTNTHKKISEIGFQAAYPFVGRKSALVKTDGNYGIVDSNGKLLTRPIYKVFQLWHTPMRENFVALCQTSDCSSFGVFDLQKGEFIVPDNGCAELYVERERIIPFKGENKKYGVSKLDENYQNGKTIIQPIYDTIYHIRKNFIVAKKNGKIGMVNETNNAVLPFSYSKVILSKADPNLIGLKINSNWEYYNVYNKPIIVLKSKFECENIGEMINENGFGIYKINNKYNLLFKDGTSLSQNYEWISDKDTIAIDGNKVFIFGNDKTPFLYYEK